MAQAAAVEECVIPKIESSEYYKTPGPEIWSSRIPEPFVQSIPSIRIAKGQPRKPARVLSHG